MRPILFIHIGHSKTGTTTIQRSLQIHADLLRKHGLLLADGQLEFPLDGPVKHHPLGPIQKMLGSLPASTADLTAMLDRLRATLQAHGLRGAVISSENLSAPEGAVLFAGAREVFEIKVLHLVRRQDDWLESAWKQWGLKLGQDIETFVDEQLARGMPDYTGTARAWREMADSFTMLPMQAVPDLTTTVWNWLGLGHVAPPAPPWENSTYDRSVLEVLVRNPWLFADHEDNTVFESLDVLCPANVPRDGHGLLNHALASRVMEHYREENARLQREYFPEAPGLADGTRREAATAPATEDVLFRFLGIQTQMLTTVSGRLAAHDRALKQLRKEVDVLKESRKELKALAKAQGMAIKTLEAQVARLSRNPLARLFRRMG